MKKKLLTLIITISLLLLNTLIIGSSFEGIERIKESGQLRILMAKDDWWPFFHVDEEGVLSGIDIIVSKKICENLGVEPIFIRKDSFNQLAPALKRGEGDVIISYFSYTPQRNTDVYLTSPYILSTDSLLINNRVLEKIKRNHPEPSSEVLTNSLDEENYTIASVKGTSHEIWVEELFEKAEIKLYEPSQIEDMLNDKAVDAFYFDEIWTRFFLALNPEFYLNYSFFNLQREDQIVVGVAPDNLSLYLWLENFITTNLNMNQIIDNMYTEISKGISDYLTETEATGSMIRDPWRYLILFLILTLGFILIYTSQKKQPKENRQNWLFNFWTIIFSMIAGVYCGIAFPALVDFISPFGDIFFNYLLLFGIPILFFVVLINFVKLMMKMGGMHFFMKFMGIVLLFFFIGSLIGVIVGIVGQPGMDLPKENRQQLAQAMEESADEKLADSTDL